MATRTPLYLDFAAGEIKEFQETDLIDTAFMQQFQLYPYDGTGAEGSNWTIAGLSGKTVSGIFRAGMFKRVITTVPTDTESIKVSGTTIALQTGDALVPGERLDFLYY